MTTRVHKASKLFETNCRPQFVLNRYVRMYRRIGLSRAEALARIQKFRDEIT